MNASVLLQLMNQMPFEPLEVHLNNGTAIEISEPYQVATAPNSPAFTVYLLDKDEVRHVAFRNVAEIVSKAASTN